MGESNKIAAFLIKGTRKLGENDFKKERLHRPARNKKKIHFKIS